MIQIIKEHNQQLFFTASKVDSAELYLFPTYSHTVWPRRSRWENLEASPDVDALKQKKTHHKKVKVEENKNRRQ